MLKGLKIDTVRLIEEHDRGPAEVFCEAGFQTASGNVWSGKSFIEKGVRAGDEVVFNYMVCPPLEEEWVAWILVIWDYDGSKRLGRLGDRVGDFLDRPDVSTTIKSSAKSLAPLLTPGRFLLRLGLEYLVGDDELGHGAGFIYPGLEYPDGVLETTVGDTGPRAVARLRLF